MPKLTRPLAPEALAMMRHALFATTDHEFRNRYCAAAGGASDRVWSALVECGLAGLGATINGGEDGLYFVTDEGRCIVRSLEPDPLPAWLVELREESLSWTVRAKSRSAARMSVAYNMMDVGYTMRDALARLRVTRAPDAVPCEVGA